MRTPMSMIAAVGIAIALVACGDEGTSTQTTVPAATTAAPTTTTSADQLKAVLLDAGDIWEGWKVGENITPEDLASFAQSPCENVAVNPTIAQRLTAATGIQFEPIDRSYKHMIELVVTGDPKQLDTDLQALIGATQSCPSVASTIAGGGSGTVHELSIPTLGDQRAAFVYTALESASGPTWYIRSAIVRVGSLAVGLGLTEILSTAQDKPQISDEQFVKLLETAVAKLSD